jgi:hypothetical protein
MKQKQKQVTGGFARATPMGREPELVREPPTYLRVQQALDGGYMTIVRLQHLEGEAYRRLVAVVDEDGMLKQLPYCCHVVCTETGRMSDLYGPVLLMAEVMTSEGADFAPLTDEELGRVVLLEPESGLGRLFTLLPR